MKKEIGDNREARRLAEQLRYQSLELKLLQVCWKVEKGNVEVGFSLWSSVGCN